MSMIGTQVQTIRDIAKYGSTFENVKAALNQAADTIEVLYAKLAAVNMEQSDRYYREEKELIESMMVEIENRCNRTTELTERARKYLSKTDYCGGWIACEDRLPEESGEYNVTDENGKSTTLYYDKKQNVWVDIGEMAMIGYPLAWQPLPEPYNP